MEPDTETSLDSGTLAALCRQAGADDVGFVEIGRDRLAAQRESLLRALPWTRSFLVFVRRLSRAPIRAPLRSLSSAEFTEGAHDIKAIIHRTVRALEEKGVRAVGISGLFPTEIGRPDGSPFVVSLKDLAEAAGLGLMGKSRLLLHPRFGAYVYLGAIALDRTVTDYDQPLAAVPCLTCNLCAVTCPTGAISRDGHFDFASCMTHNYREKVGGFVEWVHTLADSRNRRDYRRRVSDAETLSWWQSLGYDANTHCDYCIAVCPAGAEADSFRADRKSHFRSIVAPLRDRAETVYVVPGSDAEAHLARVFPHKTARRIGSGISTDSVTGFVRMLALRFQRGQADGLAARYHFRFHGRETLEATVDIRDNRIRVEAGLVGKADLTVSADSQAWLGYLGKERWLPGQRLFGRIRLKGSPRLLTSFVRCFPC